MKSYKGLCDIVIDVQQKSTLAAGSKMAWRVWFQAAGESWEAVVMIQSSPMQGWLISASPVPGTDVFKVACEGCGRI